MPTIVHYLWIFSVCQLFCGVVLCGTVTEMTDLIISKVFNNSDYSPRVRPIRDSGYVLNVFVDLYLIGINEVSEVGQTISTTAYLKIEWNDTFMVWNSTQYGGIEYFSLPQESIWKPDLALANAADTITGLGTEFVYITITSQGTITWKPFEVFLSSCKLDMTYFPFDTQKCDIQFVTWSSTVDMINLIPGKDGINTDIYSVNSNWDLLGATTYNSSAESVPAISFQLKMKRKPIYYLINFIFPILCLSLLNSFVFILPCESEEKSGIAIILFMSFAIFLLIVTEIMPKGMNNIPIMSLYLLLECVVSTLIVCITIIQTRMHEQEDHTSVPTCLKSFVRFFKAYAVIICLEGRKNKIENMSSKRSKMHGKKSIETAVSEQCLANKFNNTKTNSRNGTYNKFNEKNAVVNRFSTSVNETSKRHKTDVDVEPRRLQAQVMHISSNADTSERNIIDNFGIVRTDSVISDCKDTLSANQNARNSNSSMELKEFNPQIAPKNIKKADCESCLTSCIDMLGIKIRSCKEASHDKVGKHANKVNETLDVEFEESTSDHEIYAISGKTEFRLKDILGVRNEVTPENFFQSPVSVVRLYKEQTESEDFKSNVVTIKPPKLANVSVGLRQTNEMERTRSSLSCSDVGHDKDTISISSMTSSELSEESAHSKRDEITWPDVAQAMDTLFLTVFFVFTVVAIVVVFGILATN